MRYLFVTLDAGGNLYPELALAERLLARGHGVRFLGPRSQRALIEGAGCAFSPYRTAPDYDSTEPEATPLMDWTGEDPSVIWTRLCDHLFFGPADRYADDLFTELEQHDVDALAVDYFLFGALAAAEKSRIPTAVLWHTVYGEGDWWNVGLPTLNAARAGIDLPPLNNVFEQYRHLDRVLVLTTQAFDLALSKVELPPNVRYVGPQNRSAEISSAGFKDMEERPLVLVSLSTSYQGQEGLLERVVAALGTLPVRGLVTTGRAVHLDMRPPANVEVKEWVSHSTILPRTALVITHAGLGTVMSALSHGVPLLCLPMGRDQHGNAARVHHLGAGVVLPAEAGVTEIATAVRAALADPSLRPRAQGFARTIRAEIATDPAVTELERLATAFSLSAVIERGQAAGSLQGKLRQADQPHWQGEGHSGTAE